MAIEYEGTAKPLGFPSNANAISSRESISRLQNLSLNSSTFSWSIFLYLEPVELQMRTYSKGL